MVTTIGAVCGQLGRVVVLALAEPQAAAVDPDHDRPAGAAVLAAGGGVHVQVEAVLRRAGDAERRRPAARSRGRTLVASRTPLQLAAGWGARQRSGPTGGAA